jgi:hypothetical protein
MGTTQKDFANCNEIGLFFINCLGKLFVSSVVLRETLNCGGHREGCSKHKCKNSIKNLPIVWKSTFNVRMNKAAVFYCFPILQHTTRILNCPMYGLFGSCPSQVSLNSQNKGFKNM